MRDQAKLRTTSIV